MNNKPLKIITYNIHKGFSINRKFVLPQMRDALQAIDADIVFLQEVRGEHLKQQERIKNWPKQTQAEFIADAMWPYHVYGKNAYYAHGHHGNAILSKFPIVEWENINLATSRFASRSLLHGKVEISGTEKPLHIICIHLGLFKNERLNQLDMLSQRIEEVVPWHEPLIIAGDFNDWQGHAKNYLETHLEVREIFKILTGRYVKSFPVWHPTLRVDRIYYRGLQPHYGEVLNKEEWQSLSDHSALYAEFYL